MLLNHNLCCNHGFDEMYYINNLNHLNALNTFITFTVNFKQFLAVKICFCANIHDKFHLFCT